MLVCMTIQAADTFVNPVLSSLANVLAHPSRTPRYERLATALAEEIRAGRLAPGAALLPEPEFARRLGVSRQTVNQALTLLAKRGLVRRTRGSGTFIADLFVEQPLDGLYSFLRTLTAQGRLPSAERLGARLTVDADASVLLTGASDGLVFELTRLRSVDGTPFVLETLLLPAECREGLLAANLDQETVYDVIRRTRGIVVTHAEETMQPVTTARPESALLGLSEGAPAFLVVRTSYVNDRAVEFRRSLIRGDRYRFRVRLSGDGLAWT
jgi:GntR family transcriptional regulator